MGWSSRRITVGLGRLGKSRARTSLTSPVVARAVVVLALTVFMFAVAAAQALAAPPGSDWTYSVSGGSATIESYSGIDTNVIVPSSLGGYPVVAIGDLTFYDNVSLTSVTIPEGVTSIGWGAFQECSALETVTVPASVARIAGQAFYDCRSLKSVTIPAAVTSVSDATFMGCSSLTSVVIPDGVTSIGTNAFNDCLKLKSVNIPDGVTSISDLAFCYCQSLTSLDIPATVTNIGQASFLGCGFTNVTIPAAVTNIGGSAFKWCRNLTSATFLGDAPKMGSAVFDFAGAGFKVFHDLAATGFGSAPGPWAPTGNPLEGSYATSYSNPPAETLSYTAGIGGSIEGSSTQITFWGADGWAVTAKADPGYRFERWSDGVLTATRRDTFVIKNVTIDAVFVRSSYAISATTNRYLGSWAATLPQAGAGDGILGIAAAANGDVYVADPFSNRVQRFDATGRLLGELGTTRPGEGHIEMPIDVAVGPQGDVYVLNVGNRCVVRFDANGVFKGEFAGAGKDNGLIALAYSLAIAPNGDVYVCDTFGGRVEYFDADGAYKGKWTFVVSGDEGRLPVGIDVAPNGDVYLAGLGGFVNHYGPTGENKGEWIVRDPNPAEGFLWGITIAPDGKIYLPRIDTGKVTRFNGDGADLGSFGGFESGEGRFGYPTGACIGPDGTIYVADGRSGLVHRYGVVHGKISPSGDAAVAVGSDATFTVTPDTGYHVSSVLVDGNPASLTDGRYVFSSVNTSHTISAEFAVDMFSVNYTANAGGSIEGSATQAIAWSTDCTAVTAKADAGYHFVSWSDGVVTATRVDRNATGNVSVSAAFAHDPIVAVATDDVATAFSRRLTLTPLVNDNPAVGSLVSLTAPAHGSASLGDAGVVIYTPAAGYLGADSFSYATSSGAAATVWITVAPGLSAPSGPVASEEGSTSVRLSWTKPTDVGSGLAAYRVRSRAKGTTTWNTSGDIAVGTTSSVVSSLAAGATYEFEVVAIDTQEYEAASGVVERYLPGAPVEILPVVTDGAAGIDLSAMQLSGDSTISVDPNVGATIPGVATAVIVGRDVLRVTFDPDFSGTIDLPLTVTNGGGSTVVYAHIVVLPRTPYSVKSRIVSAMSSLVQWAGSANATGYKIFVDGKCVATLGRGVSGYTYKGLLGPTAVVAVESLGGAETISERVIGTYIRSAAPVVLGNITFAGNSAKLSTSAQASLKRLAAIVAAQRFDTVEISGYTARMPHGNATFRKRLAAARASATKSFLAKEFTRLHVKVKAIVIAQAGGKYLDTPASAKNRRAAIGVR